MSLRTRVHSFIHRTVKIFSFCLTSTLESRSELEKLSDRYTRRRHEALVEDLKKVKTRSDKFFDPKRRLISPQSHGSLTASPKDAGNRHRRAKPRLR
ncbi:hypothetical protein Bca101_098201 [Brassica carinata]